MSQFFLRAPYQVGYSFILQNNLFMRWMNLEPIIQSEVSQKEKDKYHILMHICRIQKNDTEEFIYRAAKAFDSVDHNKLWKILKEMGIVDHLICLLRNLYAGQEATVLLLIPRVPLLELDGKQLTGLGVEYVEGVYCHPTYLTYMRSTSCEMLGWMKHKLESILLEEYQ